MSLAGEGVPKATQDMAAYCFAVLENCLAGAPPPQPTFCTDTHCPFFVTWELRQGGNDDQHHLRGCIGTLSPRPLSDLADYTRSSAFRDRRFDPIEERELPKLRVAVSLLINYEEASHPEDWEVGLHGIVINFSDHKGGKYTATYLPEVASEQGWTQKEALVSLIRKAGYRGTPNATLMGTLFVTRYQSSKTRLSYSEFLEHRSLRAT